ncbi:MAG TPA: CAP domain-containing protein [Terriglobales bacterium]|nr:CAP domain-containing protein [Terriglobales bacterium]
MFIFFPQARACAEHSGESDPAGARELLRLVNQERAKHGRAALEWDDRLEQVALEHAYLMAEHKQISHQFSGEPNLRLRLAKTSIRLDHSGENVADDNSGIISAHVGLMNSPPHRANILSPDYNAIGIAVVKRGGYYYVVEDFAHRLPEVGAAEVEGQITAAFDRARRESGQAPLTRTPVRGLRDTACSMARNDAVNARNVDIPQARYVLAFTISEPERLPADLLKLRSNQEIGSYAIASCFGRTPSYPNGVFWNVMVFFPKTSSSRSR